MNSGYLMELWDITNDSLMEYFKEHIMTGRWFGTFFIFPYIGKVVIPTDELIFFREVGIPPTRYICIVLTPINPTVHQVKCAST